MSQAQPEKLDLAVVGGGPIGLACAWRAAQRGLRVCVLEREAAGAGAAHVAAGMLAPATEAEFGEGITRRAHELALRSAASYPDFVDELERESGMRVEVHDAGTLIVARDRDEAEALERELAHRASLRLDVERLRPSRARALEPALAPSIRLAALVPGDRAVDPRQLVAALARALGAAGGKLRERTAVAAVTSDAQRVTGVELVGGERVDAARVLVCAGCWSGALGGLPAGARVPVRPVKGQVLRLHDPAGPGLVERVVRTSGAYLVPRGDGRYVLGATVEERGFDRDVTAGAVRELLRDAEEVVPGVAELVLDELAAGLRPGSPDNAPILGPGALEGLWWATGHYRNGILLAPVTAELVAAQLVGEAPDALGREFAPARFAATLQVVA